MIILHLVMWAAFIACLSGQGADCISTDINRGKGGVEGNRLLAWAVRLRWPSYLIKFGLPVVVFYLFYGVAGGYAIRHYQDDVIGPFAAIVALVPGAIVGWRQARSNWK